MEAHLSNLDPNMRITTGVVSVTRWSLRASFGPWELSWSRDITWFSLERKVTGAMDLVKLELDLRDRCREEWWIHVSSCVMPLCDGIWVAFNGGC